MKTEKEKLEYIDAARQFINEMRERQAQTSLCLVIPSYDELFNDDGYEIADDEPTQYNLQTFRQAE